MNDAERTLKKSLSRLAPPVYVTEQNSLQDY